VRDMKKVIALTMRVLAAEGYHELRDAISADWSALFRSSPYLPVFLPNTPEIPADYFKQFRAAAVVLTGGNDLSPVLKGADRSPASLRRDRFEKKLLAYAIRNQIPVIGICRGMQVINAFFNGTLKRVAGGTHSGTSHPIALSADFKKILGNIGRANSFHDYCIVQNSLGPGLIPFAWSPDGVVEGIVHCRYPIIGMMWHPERPGGHGRLFFKIIDRLLAGKHFPGRNMKRAGQIF
jgi:N5-(cytidine 5'-diphosphoramidyl)-L-glutamine hydrolase